MFISKTFGPTFEETLSSIEIHQTKERVSRVNALKSDSLRMESGCRQNIT